MGELEKKPAKLTVGESIKIFRKRNGWSQEFIANRLGISIPALSKIETGVTDVNLSRLEQIANVYEVSLPQLMNVYNDELEPIVFTSEILRRKISEQESEITALQRKVIELYDELHSRKSASSDVR